MQIPVVRVTLPRHCYVYYHFSQLHGKPPIWSVLRRTLRRDFQRCYNGNSTLSQKKKEEKEDAWDLKVKCISPFQKLICSRHYPAFASHWKILPFLSHEKQTFPLSGGNMNTAWQTQSQTSFSSFFFFFAQDIVRVWQPRGPPIDSDGVINTFIQ